MEGKGSATPYMTVITIDVFDVCHLSGDDDSHKTSNKPFSFSPKSNSRQSDKEFSWDDDLEP